MSMIEPKEIERRIADRLDTSIVGALEVSRHAGGLAFTNAGEAMEFAKMMAVSQIGVRKHLRGNVGACLAITVQSIEWGMSPFAVANKSYLVNDQIAYESQLVQAVILRRAPIKRRFKYEYSGEGAKRRCKVTATLIDGETVDYETPEVGRIPVQNSPLWKSDPDQQLSYYAGRALCRRHFPDVLLGVYDVDELPETPRDPAKARDVTPPTLAARLDALAAPAPAEEPPAQEVDDIPPAADDIEDETGEVE
jgi:RecT family